MQHCLKSRRFWVSVPVLSLSRCPTWPSSSLSEVFLAWAGESVCCQYISRSHPINLLWIVWITSKLWTTHTHTHAVRQRAHKHQCVSGVLQLYWRDVESYGHGRAQQDDVAPEGKKPCIRRVVVHRRDRHDTMIPHDPARKHAVADGEEQGDQQHRQDYLKIRKRRP